MFKLQWGLAHLFLLIFQQTGHFCPSAFKVSTLISFEEFFSTFAFEVMHNSEKSMSFVKSINLSSNFITRLASKLDPISLDALLISILLLQTSLNFN